jgi:tetratricopeptide (TPR) repeat protein
LNIAIHNRRQVQARHGRGAEERCCGRGIEKSDILPGKPTAQVRFMPPDAENDRNTNQRGGIGLYEQAVSAHRKGDLREASRLYEAAAREHPNNISALYNLAVIQYETAPEDAVNLFRRVLERKPGFPEALNGLGSALVRLRRFPEAVACLREAVAARPDFADAHNNLGGALKSLGRDDEAAVHFQRAIALDPRRAESRNNLGTVLHASGRHAEAEKSFREAIAIRPGMAEAHANLGASLVTLGRLAEGRSAIQAAIGLSPRTASFYRILSESKRFAEHDPHLAAMELLARRMESLAEDEQMHLHFALGKAYADIGRQDQSLQHFMAGNAIKRGQVVHDEEAWLRALDPANADVTAGTIARLEGLGDPSAAPVFIVGMPRSGSTLVEQILASHPQVLATGERRDFMLAMQSVAPPLTRLRNAGREEAGPVLRDLGAAYLHRIFGETAVPPRFTDKQLDNFRCLGLIHLGLPNARIIHVRRDPVDTCMSCFSTLFASAHAYSYDLAELGRAYGAYDALMDHWRAVLPASVFLEVRYEDVVDDLEGQARRILAHCGLGWDDACLAFHRTARPVHTASAVQVREPVYRRSIGRWDRQAQEIRPLLDSLKPVLSRPLPPDKA